MAFTAQEVQRLQDMANRLRIDSVVSTQASKSGYDLHFQFKFHLI